MFVGVILLFSVFIIQWTDSIDHCTHGLQQHVYVHHTCIHVICLHDDTEGLGLQSHANGFCRVCTQFHLGEMSRQAQSLAHNGHPYICCDLVTTFTRAQLGIQERVLSFWLCAILVLHVCNVCPNFRDLVNQLSNLRHSQRLNGNVGLDSRVWGWCNKGHKDLVR